MISERSFLSIFALLICMACGRMVTTDITTYHVIEKSQAGVTFAVVPSSEQRDSLEFQSFAKAIKIHLEALGMNESPLDTATIGVLFTYGIDNGRTVTSSYPILGITGTSGSYTTGTATSYGGRTTFSATTTPINTYGVTGYVPVESTVYKRVLNVDMIDLKASKEARVQKVYEGRAISIGSSGNITEILPLMIDCVFSDFPGKSGTTLKCTKQYRQ